MPRQAEPFSHADLQEAMLKTIQKLNAWCNEARIAKNNSHSKTSHSIDDDDTDVEASVLNFAVSDGVSIVCTRYINSSTLEPASLYFSSGSRFECDQLGHYRMVKESAKREDIIVIASEPLTFEEAEWREVPRNSMVVITARMNVLIIPIVDGNSKSSVIPVKPEKMPEEQPIIAEDTAAVVNLTAVAEHDIKGESAHYITGLKDVKRLPEAIFINAERRYQSHLRSRASSNDSNHLEGGYSMTPSMSSYPYSSFIPSSPSSASSASIDLSHLNEEMAAVMDESGKGGRFYSNRRESDDQQFRMDDCGSGDESEIEEDYRIYPAKPTLQQIRF
ncbi:hypothetical protein BGX27_006619 [Mortierella sp. AM989]|nr:hypothetical protein BGX27_006619 [Mortierella sp. AM989]